MKAYRQVQAFSPILYSQCGRLYIIDSSYTVPVNQKKRTEWIYTYSCLQIGHVVVRIKKIQCYVQSKKPALRFSYVCWTGS